MGSVRVDRLSVLMLIGLAYAAFLGSMIHTGFTLPTNMHCGVDTLTGQNWLYYLIHRVTCR
jgi:hypothetical protein